jgi:hypothetical protein
MTTKKRSAFEVMSKRRKGYPSETNVKRGRQIVHGGKELIEKLGRQDPCPCGSGRQFQELLHEDKKVMPVAGEFIIFHFIKTAWA